MSGFEFATFGIASRSVFSNRSFVFTGGIDPRKKSAVQFSLRLSVSQAVLASPTKRRRGDENWDQQFHWDALHGRSVL